MLTRTHLAMMLHEKEITIEDGAVLIGQLQNTLARAYQDIVGQQVASATMTNDLWDMMAMDDGDDPPGPTDKGEEPPNPYAAE